MTMEKLNTYECHFTWDLKKEDADLNYLDIKFTEHLTVQIKHEGGLRQRELNFLAYIKHLQGFNDKALKYLEKAKQENSDHATCVVTYGNLAWLHHYIGGDSLVKEKLIEILESLSTSGSECLRTVQSEKSWSFLWFSKKYYDRAKESFLTVLQKEPNDKEWNTGYAFSLFHLEGQETREDRRVPFELSHAASQLKKALKLDPDNAMIYVYLGLKCYKNKKNSEAWLHMRKALDMAPFDLSVVLHVAKFMKKEQCYDMAMGVLQSMLDKAPDSSRLHHEIANNYRWKAWQIEDTHNPKLLSLCIQHLKDGARLNPDFIYPQIELALRYAEVKNYALARQKFEELIACPNLKPADIQAWHRYYGDFNMYHLGSEATAVNHYKKGLALKQISTEWKTCKNRLFKVLRNCRKDVYHIQEFINSLEDKRYLNTEMF